MYLKQALSVWATEAFESTLKQELADLEEGVLPLQQGLRISSYAGEIEEVVLFGAIEEPNAIRVKVGVFYAGTMPGCSCADDPTPLNKATEYCELLLWIDKQTAVTSVTLLE